MVNELRRLARWMRMPCCTNQSSVAKVGPHFSDCCNGWCTTANRICFFVVGTAFVVFEVGFSMIRLESNHFDDFCSRIFLSILSGWFSFSCGGPHSSPFLEGAKWSELVHQFSI